MFLQESGKKQNKKSRDGQSNDADAGASIYTSMSRSDNGRSDDQSDDDWRDDRSDDDRGIMPSQAYGWDHALSFRLMLRMALRESQWLGRPKSSILIQANEIRGLASGSRVVRLGRHALEYDQDDCGILQRIGGQEWIASARLVEGEGRMENDVNEGKPVLVDNTYLRRKDLDLKDVLYQLSKVVDLPIQLNST